MPKVDEELYFSIDEKNNQVETYREWFETLSQEPVKMQKFFILPDISTKIADIDKTDLNPEEKLQRKDNLMTEYGMKAERIHTIQQLLKAYTLFDKDVEYVIIGRRGKDRG